MCRAGQSTDSIPHKMRSSGFILAVGLVFIAMTDTILWYQLRRCIFKKWQISLYILHSLFFLFFLTAFQTGISRLKGPGAYFWIETLIGVLFLFYVPKVVFIVLNGIGKMISRLWKAFSRVSVMAASSTALFFFVLILYSITIGRYQYKIEIVEIPFKQLPPAFNGFKIVQLSDLHLGSYGKSYRGINDIIRKVNELHPDVIVFTGDMVNNFAVEMEPWIGILQGLEAPYGKYAVTGNHDYGDYTHWPDSTHKRENLRQFCSNMEKMGFQMLNNAHIPVIMQSDTIWIAGVENWGNPPFPRYGDLSKATGTLEKNDFVILLSHDPSHWRGEALDYRIPLTLSGHTHAMQMGIHIGNFKWSPSQYLYPEYDGLYRQGEQYLYVSRGQGYLGFPGRIGLRPVITELILTTASRQ